MQCCRRFRVSGVVQGVGFRYHAQKVAARTGLNGWVRNLHDGSVELVACGTESQIEVLQGWLREGPRMARVNQVEEQILESSPCPPKDGFFIR